MASARPIKVLAIDGGGIRGIIPALVLARIEALTGRPVCELFDLIAGTSTGGIIALGVTVPERAAAGAAVTASETAGGGGRRRPRWSAARLADMYASEGPKIFHHSLLRTLETADGLIEEKYSVAGLEAALERYMGDALLSQSLADVLVTSYDIHSHEPFFFKSFLPRPRAAHSPRDRAVKSAASLATPEPLADYPTKVVARATSAAPTYFEPEPVRAASGGAGAAQGDSVLVDGGTFANNLAMCAYAEALRNHPGADVLVVSLGTGRLTESISYEEARHWGLLQWVRPLLGVIMDGSSAAIDYQLDELLGADVGHFRFQAVLEGASDRLDDASPANIAGLRKVAEGLIERNAARLATVCERLTSS